ncbi:MAG: TonB C-terminal domain-containing protein [Sulfuricurvum sp.]|nr:TonB C-terminal domain-containing protein [Sulfuricurvum sp.]
MNLHYQRYFFQSGIITFFLFGIILSFFMNNLVHPKKPDAFAMRKSDVISISLEDALTPVSKVIAPSAPVSQQIVKEEVKSVSSPSTPVQEVIPAIDDLFATVKTTKSKPKPMDNAKQMTELNALEEKVLATKRDSKIFDKVKTLELAKSGVKMVSSSTGPAVNEYNAKIQGIIYANFHPANGTEGFAARIRITLSADGRLLAYRVISYSGNAVFNAEVDWLKERLRQIGLPQHPQGEEAIFEIILTAKE